MAEQKQLPGFFPDTARDFSTELILRSLPESARPVYLDAYRRASRLRQAGTVARPQALPTLRRALKTTCRLP